MLRHISIVIVGLLLVPLLFAAAGFGLYHLAQATNWPEYQVGGLARYVLSPVVAVVVGIVVGALAQSRPGILAGLSVGPWVFLPALRGQLSIQQRGLVLLLAVVTTGIGCAVATLFFRVRGRARRTS
jgi:hypothetical protein